MGLGEGGGVPTYTGHQPLIHTFNILSLVTSTFVTAVALVLTDLKVSEYFKTIYYLEVYPIDWLMTRRGYDG